MGFEPTISEGERQQTSALDRAATGTRHKITLHISIHCFIRTVYKHSNLLLFLAIVNNILYNFTCLCCGNVCKQY